MKSEPIGFGDLVEILSGSLKYKQAFVWVWAPETGEVPRAHADWMVSPTFPRAQVQLIRKAALTRE
ncbi:MAG: hypothetical protein F6K00_27170 [Leptolyngbya sp. SIOISBB]|nr:hypothetical protein [Leptolyngbya sp. SIOISBB]